jgi:hypothetical protein
MSLARVFAHPSLRVLREPAVEVDFGVARAGRELRDLPTDAVRLRSARQRGRARTTPAWHRRAVAPGPQLHG